MDQYQTKNRKKFWFRGIVLAILIIEMFLYTWCRIQYLQFGYDIRSLEKRIDHLASLKNELQIEQTRLRSPERIIQIARKQLYLEMPSPKQIIEMP
ncbi:cell division protein FtsL family protein [Candidatus Magnetomorum sp. HK-1]|nr:cell division protein FtsL family protein [Candidatus Magnetomorum sp. HK-1]